MAGPIVVTESKRIQRLAFCIERFSVRIVAMAQIRILGDNDGRASLLEFCGMLGKERIPIPDHQHIAWPRVRAIQAHVETSLVEALDESATPIAGIFADQAQRAWHTIRSSS